MKAREIVLGRQSGPVRETVAENAITQDQIDPPRFRFAQLLRHDASPKAGVVCPGCVLTSPVISIIYHTKFGVNCRELGLVFDVTWLSM